MEAQPKVANWLESLLIDWHVLSAPSPYLVAGVLLVLALVAALLIDQLASRLFLSVVDRLAARTKTTIDDLLVEHRVFSHLAHLLPVYFIEAAIPYVFAEFPGWIPFTIKLLKLLLVLLGIRLLNALITALGKILGSTRFFRNKPIDSYTQLARIIVYLVAGIFLFSIAFDKSPVYLFSALGAMTAVLLLIFKDTILGFVASIQLASNDMVRIGDWVTMQQYGADGDVFEINLTTIKVRNFDNTISTIPTYRFTTDSFKNWRGMSESGGRRIKRSLSIDVRTVRFLTSKDIEDLKKIALLHDFLKSRQQDVEQFNQRNTVDKSELINGRNLTNLGVYRAYLEAYLRENSALNLEMTCMVRQLAAGEHGVPLEIYAFSANKDWVAYEGIMADIFDHALAAVDRFELAIFQSPSGQDLEHLSQGLGE
ncbi:MAG: mechanosensitive ion channel family protein [Salibacteraceae bacterium]